MSLPSWERGLKLKAQIGLEMVAGSLPSWERGLKSSQAVQFRTLCLVAPFVGAWIEIAEWTGMVKVAECRSLRGSVD